MTALRRPDPAPAVRPLTWRASAGVACTAGVLAWVGAQGGKKGVAALAVAAAVGAVLVLSHRRRDLAVVAAVLGSAAIVHKNFGVLSPVSSGPPSVFLSSVDVLVALPYLLWVLEGTVAADVRRAWRVPMVRAPLWGALLMAPSIVVSPDLGLTVALLLRMASLYALFLYVAARTRSRRDVWLILATFAALAGVQLVVVVGQWVTHSTLGLSFLGTPAELGSRITDAATLGRPFGTIIHPVFMGAFVGIIALLALSVAIHVDDRRIRAAAVVTSAAAVLPMVIAHTRSALLAVSAAGLVLVAVSWHRRRISSRALARWLAAAGVAAVCLSPQLSALWSDNLKTEHFTLEVDSRLELNAVAVDMVLASPVVGHGPNGFEQVMGRFDTVGLIFADNPVHNLFLLQLAETGIIGFVGLLVVGASFGAASLRLGRAREPLHAAVGAGFGAVLLFVVVEEQFVFSLRQEHPATLFWIAAGLVAACTVQRRAGAGAVEPSVRAAPAPTVTAGARPGRHQAGPPGAALRTRRTRRRVAVGAVGAVTVLLVSNVAVPTSSADVTDALDGTMVVMTLRSRVDGLQSIWTMGGDGSGLRRVSPADGRHYSWAEWAFNGTKIVYSVRSGPAGSPEAVHLMDPDGSGSVRLTDNPWQNGQPRVSPDGTHLLFTSAWDEYERFGVYAMDLATGLVRNLTAASSPTGGVDADAKWTPAGEVVLARSVDEGEQVVPTQIHLMAGDGSGGRNISRDRHYNTDPEVSPDGRTVVWASYRGAGEAGLDPGDEHVGGRFKVKLYDWFLVTHDLATGGQQTLNQGLDCAARPVELPCGPLEGPAYIPNWSPDGSAIAYLSILSRRRVCICAVGRDGSDGRVVFASEVDEIQWFDIVRPGVAPAHGPELIRSRVPASRLLLGGTGVDGRPVVASAMPDRWGELPVGGAASALLAPVGPRWSPDRSSIVFSAVLPVDPEPTGYGPLPPPGGRRRVHFTLPDLAPRMTPVVRREGVARQQVFTMAADGTGARQLTHATMEDHRDAIPDGEVRGNVEPAVSPDGRHVVVVNVSESSQESFLVRVDLRTGEVLNLTNATSGAVPVTDLNPAWSPDGGHVAFATAVGGTVQIAVVDRDGYGYRQLTDDDHVNLAPAWSPDGTRLVYASLRAPGGATVDVDPSGAVRPLAATPGWVLVTLDLATGEQRVVTPPEVTVALQPVWSPEGDRIAFISVSGSTGQPDVWVVGVDGSDPRPLQVTQRTRETSVDWR